MATPIFRALDRATVRRAARTECQVVTEEEFTLLGSRVLDVSADGLLVEAHCGARRGERVILSLRLPGTRVWIDAEGTVVRVVRGRRRGDVPAIGVRFDRIDAVDRALLVASLEGLPPPPPQRRLRRDYAMTVQWIRERSEAMVESLTAFARPAPGLVPAWAACLLE